MCFFQNRSNGPLERENKKSGVLLLDLDDIEQGTKDNIKGKIKENFNIEKGDSSEFAATLGRHGETNGSSLTTTNKNYSDPSFPTICVKCDSPAIKYMRTKRKYRN